MQGPTSTIFTNRFGCFDYDQAVEDDYILIIGDSTTWGYAPLKDKWTSLLGKAIGRQVLKCGVSGTGPRYQLIKAQQVINQVGKSPGAIIALYDSDNDFNDDIVFPGYAMVRGQRIKNLKSLDLRTGEIERYTHAELEARYDQYLSRHEQYSWKGKAAHFLKQHSALTAFLIKERAKLQLRSTDFSAPAAPGPLLKSRYGFFLWDVDTDEYPWVLDAFHSHVNNIFKLQKLAEQHEAKFILFSTYLPNNGLKGKLRKILTDELPYYMNVGDAVMNQSNGKRTGWYYNGHWNILGNRLAAEAMHRYIVENDAL
jgi:hypothetical protein